MGKAGCKQVLGANNDDLQLDAKEDALVNTLLGNNLAESGAPMAKVDTSSRRAGSIEKLSGADGRMYAEMPRRSIPAAAQKRGRS